MPQVGPQVLARNYVVKLTLKNGESAESMEILTASPRVSFSALLGKSPLTAVNLSGGLQEIEGGRLVFEFTVSGRLPEIAEAVGVNGARSIEYRDESTMGAVHIKLGADHTLFKSGSRAYILNVTAADADK